MTGATDRLIDTLADDLKPVSPSALAARIMTALAVGGVIVFIAMVVAIRLRPDLAEAVMTSAFWMKLAYAAALAFLGIAAMHAIARPETRSWPVSRFAIPVAILAAVALFELGAAAPQARSALVYGSTWSVCPILIATLSLPVLAVLLWIFRGFAPVHPRRAGALIGISAGATTAMIYALHCPEAAATFVLIWYTIGMVIPALVGAAVGSRLLRW